MQHDRTFMRPFHDVLPLLKAMMADEQLKMVAWNGLEWLGGKSLVVNPIINHNVVIPG
jgi:hypothetical protein